MRPKKPTHVLIDQVRITREGNDAIIDHADANLSGARITGIASMTDAEVVEMYNQIPRLPVGAPGGMGQESFLSCEDAVEHVDDFTVRHGRDVGSDSETRPRNAGVGIVDNRVISLARYPHLIDYGASRLPQAHLRPPRRGEYSRETWQPGNRLENACTVE